MAWRAAQRYDLYSSVCSNCDEIEGGSVVVGTENDAIVLVGVNDVAVLVQVDCGCSQLTERGRFTPSKNSPMFWRKRFRGAFIVSSVTSLQSWWPSVLIYSCNTESCKVFLCCMGFVSHCVFQQSTLHCGYLLPPHKRGSCQTLLSFVR